MWVRALGFVLLPAALLNAQPVAYEIVPSEGSRLAVEVFKTRLMKGKKHLFLFERYHGKLSYDAARPESAQVQLVIEAGSATLKDTWLSAKDFKKVQEYALDDMLGAVRHPEITFSSSGIRASGAGQYEVEGTLAIRGIAKPVRVLVAPKPAGEGALSFEGSAEIKMTAYGLKPPSAALGTVGTKDEMAFSFALTARPVAP